MGEAKAGLKARVEAELAAAADDNELKALRDRFAAEERAIEHKIDHEVHNFSATVDVPYNVSRLPLVELFPEPIRSRTPSRLPVTVSLPVSWAAACVARVPLVRVACARVRFEVPKSV